MAKNLQPEFVNRPDFYVAGLTMRGASEQDQLKALWARFGERNAELQQASTSPGAYGVIDNFDEEKGTFDYLAGVEVRSEEDAPRGAEVWRLLAQNYAVFPTTLATLHDTIDQIYGSWLPDSNYRRAPGPEFEYYGETFEPDDPESPFQLYIPVEPLSGGE